MCQKRGGLEAFDLEIFLRFADRTNNRVADRRLGRGGDKSKKKSARGERRFDGNIRRFKKKGSNRRGKKDSVLRGDRVGGTSPLSMGGAGPSREGKKSGGPAEEHGQA